MADVFISYSRKNSDFVHKLDDALTKLKREVWVDWQDIARGEDWWHSIQTGIDSADTALIIVTEHWLLSEICQRELDYIRQQNKRVFPIIRERIEGDLAIRVKGTWVDQEWEQQARDNWKYLRSLNWLFFDDDTTFDAVFNDLVTALDTDQLYIKSHTRYLVRALEWQQFHRNPSFLLEGDQLASAKEWLDSSANKHPEPHPAHHEYITTSKVAETARQTRDHAREQLIKRFQQTAVVLGVLVVVAIITAGVVGQQFFVARAEVTHAGATLQQVNVQVTDAIQQQAVAVAQANAAQNLVATATIEQGQAIAAQRTSFARENIASTNVAIANATLAPVPVTLTSVAIDINDAYTQQDISNQIANASFRIDEKQIPSAIQIMDNTVANYPDEPSAHIGRGLILESANQLDEAIKAYTTAIKVDTDHSYSSYAYNDRANVYVKQDKLDEAIADLNKSLELDPKNADAYVTLGLVYHTRQEPDKAIEAFNKAIEIDPSSFTYNNRGIIYQDQEEYDKALADFTKAIEIDPQYNDAYSNRGNIYYLQGDMDAALADYNKAIEIYSGSQEAYYNRGRIHFYQEDYDKAIDDFSTTLRLDPTYEQAYVNRAVALTKQEHYDAALRDFDEALKLNPDDPDAYLNRGNVYYFQHQPDLALADLDKAIELAPDNPEPLNNRGLIYIEQGKLKEASADFWRYVQLVGTTMHKLDTVPAGRVPFSTTLEIGEGDAYSIPFVAKDGQKLEATAASAGQVVDTLLLLLDPKGNPVTVNDNQTLDTTDSAITGYVIPEDGTYTLVLSYITSGGFGKVDVTLDLTSAEATPAVGQ